MKNRDLYSKDFSTFSLLNNGVAEVRGSLTEAEVKTLRFELMTFICEGQYSRGLSLILQTFLANLGKPEQPAVWVSGFFGSGKSHLVKMLRYLWTDYEFAIDKSTARGLATLPEDINDQLKELSTAAKRYGGIHAAAGTLGAGAGDNPRLALLGIVFTSAGLPERYPAARLVTWLKGQGVLEKVRAHIHKAGKTFEKELQDMYVSPLIAEAILASQPGFATGVAEAKSFIKSQYPPVQDVSLDEMVTAIHTALEQDGKFPCTTIILDEVQQYIGDSADKALKVQEIVEACCKKFNGQLLLVATGQASLTGTPQLQKLQGRFRVPIQLSDSDVETVIRKMVLAKKPDKLSAVKEILTQCSGETSRHLEKTKLGPRTEDRDVEVADYPLLPVRRRFWEKVLRDLDPTSTAAQLRNQLSVVVEAVKATADKPVGWVVPGDFIYDQNATPLLQTGVLLKEIYELIERLKDETPDGTLRARLCALVFLIGRLSREEGADTGVRATAPMLADLLVEDLKAGSAELRRRIPELLKDLVDKGQVMQVEEEYRLQTRVGAEWEGDYRKRMNSIKADDQRLASERANLLRTEVFERLKSVKPLHGKSKVARKVEFHYQPEAPAVTGQGIPIWVRDGWGEDERTILTDAQHAGTDSPVIFVFIPRKGADELKSALVGSLAAQESLDVKGVPGTAEGVEARNAMETRCSAQKGDVKRLIKEASAGSKVFLGGGYEIAEGSLKESIDAASDAAMARLYPQFDAADSPNWADVVKRAKRGDGSALEAVGHKGEPEKHPVCAALIKTIGGGKKGSEIRKAHAASPYGWPQDAIDGALLTLVVAGKLRAIQNGTPIEFSALDQTKIGVAEFRTENPPLTPSQRIEIRKLFKLCGLPCKAGEEAAVATEFVGKLRQMVMSAGGDPPLPQRPGAAFIESLEALMDNERLMALYEQREDLARRMDDLAKTAQTIAKRMPRWECLQKLLLHADELPEANEVKVQVGSILSERSLLAEPDPVPHLCEALTQPLRKAYADEHGACRRVFEESIKELEQSDPWKALKLDQRVTILRERSIVSIPEVSIGSEETLLGALESQPLSDLRMLQDALGGRFASAKVAAAKLLEPKATQYSAPSATLHDADEVEKWVGGVRQELLEKVKKGPVVI